MSEPSLFQWKTLYELARQYQDAAPWQWMYDHEIFGVQESGTGDTCYCSVIGRMGEVFGLVVYPGSEGLLSYYRLLAAENTVDHEVALEQRALSLIFASRDELTTRDWSIIKDLGLKFRGKNAWPLFRSSLPGTHPWYLTGEEAELFGVVLEQALHFCLEFRDNPAFQDPPDEDYIPVRVWGKEGWRSEWRTLPPPPDIEIPVFIPTDTMVQRLKQQCRKSTAIWETSFFFTPVPVYEGKKDERPYYPLVVLWVDRGSTQILHFQMFPRGEWEKVVESLLSASIQTRILPAEIHTAQEEMFGLLLPAAEKLGIKLKRTRRLTAFQRAKDGLLQDMSGRFF
ncbi:MAG TPA: hypothetical protein GXX19_10790 [Syntrophomonadaceae bacterium]|nr:hypothetical protein [Syntrophomonadaceae bacterium]